MASFSGSLKPVVLKFPETSVSFRHGKRFLAKIEAQEKDAVVWVDECLYTVTMFVLFSETTRQAEWVQNVINVPI
jgi:hypothetical protein